MKPTTTMQSNTSMSQTMYNLHTKRTLPRDVIKWMQGLDLSYSVKDYRKDMSNGFLIGEIISRYEPGRIPMHSFENSSNIARRDNNWSQLDLFFTKYTLRGIQLSPEQYDKLKSNQDPKSQQLFTFICHLYSICTKRTIQQSPPALDLPPTQNMNPNLTTSYLLKDEGLQKLQSSNLQSMNNHSLHNSGFSEKIQDRIPTRKIATNVDSGDMVDATGVGVKAQGRKMTSKKKSWNNFQKSGDQAEEEENQEPDKMIFDYLCSIMEECLPTDDPTIAELLFPEEDKFTPTELLLRNAQSIQPQYILHFLTQVNLTCEQLSGVILREINETWKFFTYFFKLFRGVGDNAELFAVLMQLISNYARTCHAREAKRLSKVFYDSLINGLIAEVKLMNNFRRKCSIMSLIYDFAGRQIQDKKTALSRLKDTITSSNVLYIQWLAVLVHEQTTTSNTNTRLLDDYIYYAQQHLTSSNVGARTAALKIVAEISKSHCSLIDKFFTAKTQLFKNSKDDPEQVYLLIEIYFNILRNVVQSTMYQTLVKGVGSNNLVKTYNPDNQKNTDELKSRVNTIAETIKQLCEQSANSSLREICSKRAIPFIQQSRHMMHVFLDYIYAGNDKTAFFSQTSTVHEFKTVNVQAPSVNVFAIKEYCNQILTEIISLKTGKGYEIEEFVQLINICLENLNVKKINMEFWEDVSLHIVKTYTRLMTQPAYAKQAVSGLTKVFAIYFGYDMKIRELSQWIVQAINTYHQAWQEEESAELQDKLGGAVYVDHEIGRLNGWLNDEYRNTRNDMINFVVGEIEDGLIGEKEERLIFMRR